MDLAQIGWTAALAEAFAPHAADGRVPARVSLEHTHIYRVVTADGERLARVSGRLRHQAASRADFPAVGDWVVLEPDTGGGDARIDGVLPRRSRFSRRAAGDPTEEQIVAANIDTVFLVTGLDDDFNPRRLERYLIVARESGATPVIVLNKADLVPEVGGPLGIVRGIAPDVDVHAVSTRDPSTLDVLRAYLGHGRTGALLGSSGVGKSTIVNRLIGEDLLRTRDVREWDSRGRHTSTARQMVILPDAGVIIDTPGMRELQLWDTSEGLAAAFTDVDALAERCRFRDCRHRQEPGCAVRAAAERGDLSEARLENFHKLQDEQAHQSRQLDRRAQIDEKRRSRTMAKALRKRVGEKRQD